MRTLRVAASWLACVFCLVLEGRAAALTRVANTTLKVPVGTVVYNEAGEVLADLVVPGTEFILAHGGKGGLDSYLPLFGWFNIDMCHKC